jgi:NhaP-type Na+/H+ or K+/H+ antiporter
MMYEHHTEPLLSKEKFIRRLMLHWLAAMGAIALSLAIGIFGYHFLEGLPWLDALLNASMILGGMGPVDPIQSDAGKVFASFYALFSGIVGILIAPIVHRFLHRHHLERKNT